MKKIITMFILALITFSGSSFASSQSEKSHCESIKLSKLDFIQAIASSAALAILQGAHRDVAGIEVFAVSDNGREAKVNITFSGTVGNSRPVSFKASVNCDADGILELE